MLKGRRTPRGLFSLNLSPQFKGLICHGALNRACITSSIRRRRLSICVRIYGWSLMRARISIMHIRACMYRGQNAGRDAARPVYSRARKSKSCNMCATQPSLLMPLLTFYWDRMSSIHAGQRAAFIKRERV